MAMHDLRVYQQVHAMAGRDVEATLNEFTLKWKQNARILDIGCGDGSITMDIWKKYMPEDCLIVASDKSQKCVDFAKENYENERATFMRLDIEEVPKELHDSFDHIISSYTFHWVNRQETAFSNVYKMLAKDGSCLLIFLGYYKAFDNYRKLSKTPEWGTELRDVATKCMSPYHDSKDPKGEITKLMHLIGFRDVSVTVQHKTFDHKRGVDEFKMLMECLNPFEGLKDKWDDFMDDYVKLDPDAGTSVYQLLVVYGVK